MQAAHHTLGGKVAGHDHGWTQTLCLRGDPAGVDGHLGPEEQHNPRPNTITGPRDVCKAREEQLHRL